MINRVIALWRGPWGKSLGLFLLMAGLLACMHLLAPEADTLTRLVDAHIPAGGVGYALYVGSVAGLICLAVPRQLLSFVGGYAFGAAQGAVLATVGVTLGCVLAFMLARRFGRNLVERRFREKTRRFNGLVTQNPFLLALVLRLFPSGNNLLFSVLAGVSRIAALPFFAGSLVGYLPQTILFSLLGSGLRVDPVWRTGVSAALFGLSCLLALWLYRRFRNELNATSVSES